jgi:predicted nucleic-acid-binding protein
MSNAETLPDTNVILRYLLADVPEQFDKAEAFFEQVRVGKQRALVLESVIVECVYVLTKFYQVPKGQTVSILIDFLQYKGIVNSDRETLVAGLRLFAENSLDLVDCLLLARARLHGEAVFTFDKALNKLLHR